MPRKNPMTRKDFTNIAYELAMTEPINSEKKAYSAWAACCRAVANAAGKSNPRFDRSRFLSACKYSYWTNRKPPA